MRGEQPLVQAGSGEIALEIAQLEREMRDRVRGVNDARYAALTRHPAEALDGEELAGDVRDVTDVQHPGLRSDRRLEPPVQVVLRRRHGELNARHLDLVAALPLIPGGEHSRIILVRRQNLVARFEVESVL